MNILRTSLLALLICQQAVLAANVDLAAMQDRIQRRITIYSANGELTTRQSVQFRREFDGLVKQANQKSNGDRGVDPQRIAKAFDSLDRRIELERKSARKVAAGIFGWW